MPRILLAGLFHETHTFLPGVTALAEFARREGAELLDAAGDGSPLAAAVETARECGWELVPAIDLRATPSATAADDVAAVWWERVSLAIDQAGPLDGVFLVLHGAMVCQSEPDVEGALLERLQARLPGVPVAGVLDLHANVSPRMAASADCLVSYCENPHTDAHAASQRAARLLDRLLRAGQRPQTVFAQPPIVWPPTGTATAAEPMRSLEALAREIEREHPEILAVNVLAGFAFADTHDTGVSFTAVTLGDPEAARQQLARLSELAWQERARGNVLEMPIAEAMPAVLVHASSADRRGPLVLVEPSDNIGGGAPGDSTGVLRALVEHRVPNAAVVLNDPQSVAALQSVPLGGRVTLGLGGKENPFDVGPLRLEVTVESRSDGRFDLEDRHSHLASIAGVHIDMGPCAVVRHGGLRILLTSLKTPPFDLGQLRSQGITPEALAVIGVKAAVAHRRAYDPIAAGSFTVATPGPCASDLRQFSFRRLRRPVYPLDLG